MDTVEVVLLLQLLIMNQTELNRVRQLPLHHSWGVQSIDAHDGASTISIEVNENMLNPAGMLHGGLLYALCDVAAYAALLSLIDENQTGLTHHINVQVLRPVNLGDHIEIKGTIIKIGKRLSFLESKAYVQNKLVANATITKSMILVQ